jgi:acetoin utilization deacetylase AcuC-like enzyme
MARVGLIYDPIYLEHDTGMHVENKERLVATMSHLEETHLINKLMTIPPREATEAELEMVHSKEYIATIQNRAKGGGGRLDPDTVMSERSYEAAIYAAGGAITALDEVMKNRASSAFSLARPPGHHATCWQAKGFCLFNNIAIAAKYGLAHLDLERILIVDFDVHHGNGTQDAFYTDQSVLYFSTHAHPFYPGSGGINEVGSKDGEGFTTNIPLLYGWGDREYQAIFEDILAPLARRYQPQVVMVSAGYDAHWKDQLSPMKMSVSGFARLIQILKVLADMLCEGRLVFCLEGGYSLEALPLSVAATLKVLLGKSDIDDPLGKPESGSREVNIDNFITMVKGIHHLD